MQFLLYCVCGGIGVATDYSAFYFIFTLTGRYQEANAIGYLAGTLVSFVLNRKITFGVRDQLFRRLALFLGVASLGFLTSALLLWGIVDILKIDARLAKLITLPVVVVLQFSLNRLITFRKIKSAPATVREQI
ncbi:MAG: GtrA family protein [Methylococcales bacterium]